MFKTGTSSQPPNTQNFWMLCSVPAKTKSRVFTLAVVQGRMLAPLKQCSNPLLKYF
jgi:hypothetical protein